MEYKNIIFDIDGTLIDGFNASVTSYRNTLKKLTNKTYDDETLALHYGITVEAFFELLNVEYTDEANKILTEEYYSIPRENSPIFDNIIELLEKLKEKGIRLGIVTSRGLEDWQDFIEYDILHYFEEFVIADDTKLHKPNPEPMLEILKRMDIKPEETIYIGDTVYDKGCAHGANVKFGAAIWGTHDNTLDGDYNFNDPLEILNIVK